MRALGRHAVFVAGFLATLGAASLARAADAGADAGDAGAPPLDVIASYCSSTDLECTVAPISFGKTITQPIAFDFDTGWIPANSDLQVRFYLKLPASTTVQLDGQLETTWPEPMTLATPGGTHGLLAFDYGLELGAQAKIDVNVVGVPVKWQGDIPGLPKIDFHMQASKAFTPWAFAPNVVSATGSSAKLRVLEVNLLNLAGIPSQLSKGGVALDVSGDLTATYQTDRIVIDPSQSGDLPITTEDGQVGRAFPGGGFVEYDVHPEGHIDYSGTLHLIPTFFIEVLGKSFDIPVVDLPVSFDIATQDFVFDAVRVHVPLPDFDPPPATLDFGSVTVQKEKSDDVPLSNGGEAKGRATGFIDGANADSFAMPSPEVLVQSLEKGKFPVNFAPKKTGKLEALLTLVTNDPDQRFIKVKLLGDGVRADLATPDGGSAPTGADSGESGSCGCRVGGSRDDSALLFSLLAVAGLGLRRTRRRRA